MDITANEIIRAIPEIEQLTIRLSRFSPFKILGVEDAEIKHSNVFKWILDPNESHGFSDKMFKGFVGDVLTSSENQDKEGIPELIHSIVLGNYQDLEVLREQDNIDILCVSELNKFVLLIENKLYSGEHSNQLARYLSKVSQQYHGYKILPVLLSFEGLTPSVESYFAGSYQQIVNIIRRLLDNHSETISTGVKDFLCQYILMIEEKAMTDPKLKSIASKIYKENKAAIDFIHSIGNLMDVTIAAGEFIKKYQDLKSLLQTPTWFTFISTNMEVKNKSNNSWGEGNPAILWFSQYYGKLKICIEVGPFDDGKTRLDFLLNLERNGIKIRESSKIESGTYTRLYTNVTAIRDWQDSQELLDKMCALYENKELKQVHNIVVKTIGEFQFFRRDRN